MWVKLNLAGDSMYFIRLGAMQLLLKSNNSSKKHAWIKIKSHQAYRVHH